MKTPPLISLVGPAPSSVSDTKKIFVLMVQNTSLPFTAIVQAVRGTECLGVVGNTKS